MPDTDLSWTKPIMRTGYAGRGLTYLVVAGFALWAVWRGGQAEGTGTALQQLAASPWGGPVLGLIFLGLLAYMIWRLVDAIWDLEAYGSGGKGAVARTGMVVTGLIHGALGLLALSIWIGAASGGGGSIVEATSKAMAQPMGRWLVGLAGLAVLGAGIYYLHKAWSENYRDHLRGARFTVRFNPVLKAGVAAQGVVVSIIGGFFLVAALRADPSEAGGLGRAFEFLSRQPFGQILVTLLCVGLLGFAVFCFVNAAYRIIPKVAGDDMVTLGRKLKAAAQG
ncbi:DUF1206 domain-containing protein [Roseisalinus antarcticus]|uniref:DUF1206 domain-containing protein n=1 Tax=Roseisalinus antarcticus TaxID=254357 RepID=A0A1Y5RIN4_9RHOB|nr:DUF1206 domain-containing protein [Roseisalinus antarcticus]SLN15603.1 hypothetical protein ROA7023_00210 [Roseisalinus antarcticus]